MLGPFASLTKRVVQLGKASLNCTFGVCQGEGGHALGCLRQRSSLESWRSVGEAAGNYYLRARQHPCYCFSMSEVLAGVRVIAMGHFEHPHLRDLRRVPLKPEFPLNLPLNPFNTKPLKRGCLAGPKKRQRQRVGACSEMVCGWSWRVLVVFLHQWWQCSNFDIAVPHLRPKSTVRILGAHSLLRLIEILLLFGRRGCRGGH